MHASSIELVVLPQHVLGYVPGIGEAGGVPGPVGGRHAGASRVRLTAAVAQLGVGHVPAVEDGDPHRLADGQLQVPEQAAAEAGAVAALHRL